MNNKIYIIRHGLTESNKKKIYAGWNDEPLCKKGIELVQEIGKKLVDFKIDGIFSSPIRRAVQTAEILNDFINTKIYIEDSLKEMKLGPWESLSENQVAEKFPFEWKLWNTEPSKLRLVGRETLRELQQRALYAIETIKDHSNSATILAVSHLAIIRILQIYCNNWPMDKYRKIDVPNAAIYLISTNSNINRMTRIK